MIARPAPLSTEPRKAQRVFLRLRDRILSGEYSAGMRIPSEPDLAAGLEVSRATVRGALDMLAKEGLVERRPGSGTFVRLVAGPDAIVADFSNVFTHLVEMGRRTDVRLLAFNYTSPTPAVAEALGLGRGERVQRSVRVRIADGQPFSYLVTYVPERIGISYSEADLRSTPLLELLERSGARVVSGRQTVGAALAGPETAAELGVETGSALLSITRVVKDDAGRGVEYLYGLYRPDLYALQLDLERTRDGDAMRWRAKSPAVPRKGPAARGPADAPLKPRKTKR